MSYDMYVEGWSDFDTRTVRLVDLYAPSENTEFAGSGYEKDSEGFYVVELPIQAVECAFPRAHLRAVARLFGQEHTWDTDGVYIKIPNRCLAKMFTYVLSHVEKNWQGQLLAVLRVATDNDKDLYIAG